MNSINNEAIKETNSSGRSFKQKLPVLLLAAVILSLSAYMIFWGTQKEGYHIDEMFSVMVIRGGNLSRPYYYYNDFFNTWHFAPDLELTVGVNAENAFSGIGRSPKIYEHLLHVAYSFSPDNFSVWPSLILNIIILAGCIVIIYLLSRMFIDNEYLALLPGLAWGLSSAAVNLVLFIRFYTFKTFLCLLLTYVVFLAVNNSFKKWRHLIAVLIITGVGVLTHQYFLVYAFFLTASVSLYLLIRKEFVPFVKFSGIMLGAAAGYEIISSGGISRIITGGSDSRADEVFSILQYGNPEFIRNTKAYGDIISRGVFGNIDIGIVLVFCVLMIITLIAVYKNSNAATDGAQPQLKQKIFLWLIMGGTCAAYILTIAYFAPYQEIRYVFCVTPVIVILLVSLIVSVLSNVGFKSTPVIFSIMTVISVLLPLGNIRDFNLHWDEVRADDSLASYYHLPVVCIVQEDYHAASSYAHLFEFENHVLFAAIGDVDVDVVAEIPFDDGLILMLWYTSDDSDARLIMDAANLKSMTYITNLVRHNVYLLE